MAISLPQLFDLLVQNGGTEEQQSVENSTVTLHSGHPESHDNIDMDICIDDLFTSVRIPENQAENGDTSGQIDNIMSRIMSLGEASSGQHPKSDISDVKKENIPSPGISRLSSSELQAEYHVKYTYGSGSNSSNPASPSDFDWKTYYRNMSPLESPWSPLDSPMSSPEARVTHSQDNTVNQFPSPEPLYALQMPTYPGIDPKLVLVSPAPSTSHSSPASVSAPSPLSSPAPDNSSLTSPKEDQNMVFNLQGMNGVDPKLVTPVSRTIYPLPAFDANHHYYGGYPAYLADGQIYHQQDHSINFMNNSNNNFNLPLNNFPVSFNDAQRQQMVSGAQQFHQFFDPALYAQQAQQDQQAKQLTTWQKKMARSSSLCEVCEDKASGWHYNVLSCEGCKGFFRRSIVREKEYTCNKANKCTIVPGNRKGCKKCRLNKCRRLGMEATKVQGSREAQMAERAEREAIQANLTSSSANATSNLNFSPLGMKQEKMI